MLPALCLLLAACGSGPATADADLPKGNALPPPDLELLPESEEARPTDGWLGRWTGVEGTYLDIAARDDGGYALTMQYTLDQSGTFAGRAEGEAILFERDGRTERLRPGTGEETGMKWLLDKRDCLVVREGEGYCRD